MSQDYTVAKELASLKEIKQSAEQRISDLSLNALNYVNDHRLHKADGGGTGGGVLICNVDDEDALDKTWQEIHDAPFAIVQLDTPVGLFKCPVTLVALSDDKYVVLSATITESNVGEADVAVDKYIASSANGYPVLQD